MTDDLLVILRDLIASQQKLIDLVEPLVAEGHGTALEAHRAKLAQGRAFIERVVGDEASDGQ